LQLSIIIVNYNVKYFLEQCLSSVIKAIKNIDAEIMVVDNNSTDDSREFFNNRFQQVKFIWKNENAGFAKANNEALQSATGERILFLNPDTIVPEDCFEKCLEFFSFQNNIGALGVRMIDGGGSYLPESKRGFPSSFTSFCKMTGLAKFFPHSKLLANYYLGHLPENKIDEIDVLSGAFLLADKKILEITGGFDEAFFMYGEDIDLSYRIQKAGFKNYYFPETTILHFKGESTRKLSPQYNRDFYGAMLLFVNKHYGKMQSSIYGWMIKVVIAGKTIFKKSNFEKIEKQFSRKAFMICEAAAFEKIQQRIQSFFVETERADNIEQVDQGDNCIVLCEPKLSFKEMIELLQQYQTKYQFMVHASGTKSIVGSTNKKTTGDSIVIED
jgi:N-acetylglucosaminyl-diphospho-decaprenol L-rhamnosyltransferase